MSNSPNWPTTGAPTTGTPPSSNLIGMVNYYIARLIFQYLDQPKAQELMALMSKQAVADDLATVLANAFNVYTAIGPQLDIIGKYVGVARNINPGATPPYWGFTNYSTTGNSIGFRNYLGTTNITGVWETYRGSTAPLTNLNDIQYQLIIQLQIILNSNNGTLASIQSYLHTLLPGFVTIIDNQNMTLTYNVSPNCPIGLTLLQEFLPKPMGVGLIVNSITTGSGRILSTSTIGRVLSDSTIGRITSVGS